MSSIITRQRLSLLRRSTLVFLCLCLLMPLSAGASGVSQVPTHMRVAMIVSPDMQLYPLRVMDRDAVSLLNLVYDGLYTLDDNRIPQPNLVEDVTVLAGGLTWLFTIREGVYFHDGRELTAHDVVATMDAIKAIADASEDPTQRGLYCTVPEVCASWSADDARTLRIQAARANYGLLYALTFPVLQAQSAMNPSPPGTGPYRIDYYAPGDTLWLSGNQNWFKGVAPHISSITADWYANADDALNAYAAEEVDIVMTRSTSALRYRGTLNTLSNAYDYSTRQLECLLINLGVTQYDLDDLKMRQAVSHAIDRSRLITAVYQGMVTAADSLQPPGFFLSYEGSMPSYNYSITAANAILDELGWQLRDEQNYRYKRLEDGERQLVLRLGYYDEAGSALRKDAANQIAEMLRAVGIRVRIYAYEFTSAMPKLTIGDYDLFLGAINFDVVPDPYFLLHSSKTLYYNGYRSSTMGDKLAALRKAEDTSDMEAMQTAFQNAWYGIQQQAAEDLPLLPLYWRNGIVLTRYPYSSIRDIREFELLKSIEQYK
ncbi:MAG: ABC transporter substrate-binding protein [Oscillospiraceae bacterium]|nr:ABC transporter substrate-binding protein [Oscillospiraceae bacterium]